MKAVPLNRYIVFFSIAIAGCSVDLATKSWIFNRPGIERHIEPVWEGILEFSADLNEGALFGMGQGWTAAFAALSVAAAIGILAWLFYAGAAHDRLLNVALACVMAGILGNLYDRLGMHGLVWTHTNQLDKLGEPVYAVRDWINIFPTVKVFFGKPWPAFNIADSMLVCGAVLLVWHAFGTRPRDEKQTPENRDRTSEV